VEELSAFAKFAPQLANPLVLIGFALFLFFGIHRALIKSRIISPLGKTEAPTIVRLMLHYGFIISTLMLLLGFAYACLPYFKPDVVTTYSGVLNPRATLVFSPEGGDTIHRIEIGQSGTIIANPDKPIEFLLLRCLRSAQFRVENVARKMKVSSQIYDREGRLIMELVRNEWKVAPPPLTWDRNYTDDALEVRDDRGLVVLQVRALMDRIQIQGRWWIDTARGTREVMVRDNPAEGGGALITDDSNVPAIVPMFEYPSERHFGELRRTK
jgi:hypothetical protein